MTNTGRATEISSFVEWFAAHPHPHKVMIAGNHDISLDESYYASSWQRFHAKRCNNIIHQETSDGFVPPPTSARSLFYCNTFGIIALENSAACIRGLQFWGSPFSPEFCNWSHSVERGPPAADLWKQIPSGTRVLLTHGPPVGYGDAVHQRRTGDVSCCVMRRIILSCTIITECAGRSAAGSAHAREAFAASIRAHSRGVWMVTPPHSSTHCFYGSKFRPPALSLTSTIRAPALSTVLLTRCLQEH